jgi:hypothetical protein
MPNRITFTTKVIPGAISTKELRKRVSERPSYVRVGLPDAPHAGDADLTLAQLGMIHEYGAPAAHIPERPFLRPALRNGQPQLARASGKLLFEVQNGTLTKFAALSRLGLLGVRLVQENIVHGEFTPLKPATIKRKGSSKPLIDTGQMMQSVTYAIEQ